MKFDLRALSVATARSPSSRRGLPCAATLAAAALLLGCGQKGPLTLPAAPSAGAAPSAASAPAAAR